MTDTVSLNKLNLRLTTAAMYIHRHDNITVLYRPGRIHIVPDALSRLKRERFPKSDLTTDILEDTGNEMAGMYHAELVELEDGFKNA
jgi:hypothetical protein